MNREAYDEIDDSMLDLFRVELATHSEALEEGLIAVEQNASAEVIERLMRAAHSIKGASRIVGIIRMADMTHQMEDLFVAVEEKQHPLTPAKVDKLLEATTVCLHLAKVPLEQLRDELFAQEDRMVELAGQLERVSNDESTRPLPDSVAETEESAPIEKSFEDMSLCDLFKVDLEQHSRALDQGLVALEADGAVADVEGLMRAAHSIKGSSRIIGLETMGQLAHVMEDVMVAVQRGVLTLVPELTDVLLQSNDLFLKAAGVPGDEIEALVEADAARYSELTRLLREIQQGKPLIGTEAKEPVVTEKPPSPTSPSKKEASPAPAKKAAAPGGERVVRVQAESLSRLMGLGGEFLVEARGMRRFACAQQKIKVMQREMGTEIERCMEIAQRGGSHDVLYDYLNALRMKLSAAQTEILDCTEEYELFSRRLEQLSDRLYNEVIISRMRPFSDGLHGFPRMVRDLSRQLGKDVAYNVAGANTQVDRDILEKMEAPLTHLVRNAVDHGLEMPEDRERAGKPRQGMIVLDAQHRAGMLHIVIQDDGRGVDLDKLRSKAVERGHVTPEMAEQLSENELLQFLFLPGFSTAKKVTDISGRGVGLDVVHAMVREVGGGVTVSSDPGKGTAFHLELPLTLSVIRALVIHVNDQQFAVPLARIDRLLQVADEQIETLEDRRYFSIEGEHLGLVPASQVLGLPVCSQPDVHHVLVVSDQLNKYALEVDCFVGQRDLVVQPLDSRLGKVPNVSAGAIREDGTPLLVLDVDDMVRSIDHLLTHGKPLTVGRTQVGTERRMKQILVVDDSLTVREVERKLLSSRGYDVTVAVDGMDGWNMLQAGSYDLVVTDVDMPRMNGIQLVERIRSVNHYSDLPVMIVSYKDREEDRLLGLRAGANYYLTKSSFHDESLVDAVIDLIGEA